MFPASIGIKSSESRAKAATGCDSSHSYKERNMPVIWGSTSKMGSPAF